ncbi:hypothetical protein QE152_g4631 [Popillia japonica]|uniref:Uncharacterized protein n=1 Tax=Popillia japonica TaxID=7064 RepID=A0AAW1N088_POPJA
MHQPQGALDGKERTKSIGKERTKSMGVGNRCRYADRSDHADREAHAPTGSFSPRPCLASRREHLQQGSGNDLPHKPWKGGVLLALENRMPRCYMVKKQSNKYQAVTRDCWDKSSASTSAPESPTEGCVAPSYYTPLTNRPLYRV